MMYQRVAAATETMIITPMRRGGMLSSSADCGMTSKPTKRNGTTTITVKRPRASVKRGSKFATEPPVPAPNTRRAPMTSSVATTIVCTMPASLTPM